jgi:hypothetical protein
MPTTTRLIHFLAFLAALPGLVQAQWPTNASAAIPKLADGKPDLTAPAPRTADGKPDLSGLWEMPRDAANRQIPAVKAGPGEIPRATFRDAGAGFKDGLPFQPWAKDLVKKRQAENDKNNPDALCLPMGLLQFHTHGQPRKIIKTAGVITIIYEDNEGLRQIFTDGRPLPGPDAEPWWYGYSVGKWDGDTLVVTTTGLRGDGWLDIIGSPTTEAAKFIEKFRRVNFGNMEIEVTVDDPKAYTQPWTVRVNHRLMPGAELIEFVCAENDDSRYHIK